MARQLRRGYMCRVRGLRARAQPCRARPATCRSRLEGPARARRLFRCGWRKAMSGRGLSGASAGLALALAAGPAAASDHSWQTVADAGVIALTAGAVGTTAYENDWNGAKQLGLG